MSTSPYIIDATKENFAEIVQKSQEMPIVVDFWAEWCGPCKQLMPVLAKLADEYGGRFLLAKVDTEAEQELAQHFQIRSIPTVKVIKGGAIVDEFTGVQPEPQIREMLDRHCAPGGPENSEEQDIMDVLSEQAMALFSTGNTEGALEALKAGLAEDPENHGARITLAQVQIATGALDDARATLETVPEDERDDRHRLVSGMFSFAEIAATAPPADELEKTLAADPNDSDARYKLSALLVLADRVEEALDHLIHIVRTDRKYEDDAARASLVQLFGILGPDHPLTLTYRRQLARLLN